MLWICYAALFLRILFFDRFDLTIWVPSQPQDMCIHWTSHYHLHPVFAGLMCGTPLPLPLKSLFLQLGIFHWFVASGGHLIFLQIFLQKMNIRHFSISFAILLLFSLTCGFEPPMARAFMGLFISWLSRRWALYLNSQQTILLAGLWTLILFPQWYASFSLQLSWLVALALPWSRKHTVQSLSVFVLLIPLSSQWSPLHLLYNLLFTPLFSSVLFPLTALCFALAPWTLVGNQLWELVITCAEILPKEHNLLVLPPPLLGWSYILVVHCAHMFFTRISRA